MNSPFPNQDVMGLQSPNSIPVFNGLTQSPQMSPADQLGFNQQHIEGHQRLNNARSVEPNHDIMPANGMNAPDYASIDMPVLQTPSQTATLALELTEGLNQIMMQ